MVTFVVLLYLIHSWDMLFADICHVYVYCVCHISCVCMCSWSSRDVFVQHDVQEMFHVLLEALKATGGSKMKKVMRWEM